MLFPPCLSWVAFYRKSTLLKNGGERHGIDEPCCLAEESWVDSLGCTASRDEGKQVQNYHACPVWATEVYHPPGSGGTAPQRKGTNTQRGITVPFYSQGRGQRESLARHLCSGLQCEADCLLDSAAVSIIKPCLAPTNQHGAKHSPPALWGYRALETLLVQSEMLVKCNAWQSLRGNIKKKRMWTITLVFFNIDFK